MNNHYRNLLQFCLFLLLFTSITSCRKDNDSSEWDTEMLLPLAHTSLSIQNIVSDSIVKVNADESLTLTYRNTIYELNLADSIISVPDTFIGKKYTLDSLTLPQTSINYRLSLGDLAITLTQNPDGLMQFLGNYILTNAGTSQVVPGVSGLQQDVYSFDASNFFLNATLLSGNLEFYVVNHLPFPITDVQYEIQNGPANTVLLSDVIPEIPAHDSVYRSYNLAGYYIENTFNFKLVNLSTPGSGGAPVFIDTTDFIRLYGRMYNLRASEANARFPSQDLIAKSEELTIDISDRKFTYLDARQGELHVYCTSSVEEALTITYRLEGAYDDYGQPLQTVIYIPAATPGSPSLVDQSFDISGYSIALTGKDGSKFNTYTQTVIAHIDSSGIIRHITNLDSVFFKFELNNIQPNYIKGYAGRDSVMAADTTAFENFNFFESGNLTLSDVDMKFNIENGFGLDANVKVNGLTAIGKNGNTVSLTGNILGQEQFIDRAKDFPLTPKTSTFSVNSSNSNIAQMLSLMPNQLIYDMEVKTNPNGNNGTYRDFAYLESRMKVNLDVSIPLKFLADHLVLRDTMNFDLSNISTNVQGIKDGTLNLIAQNRYPLEATLTLIMFDENWNVVDSILYEEKIQEAPLDANCRVNATTRTKIPLVVNEARMNQLKLAKHAIVVADFNSAAAPPCNGQPLQIYSDYKLDITFTAKFNYRLDLKF